MTTTRQLLFEWNDTYSVNVREIDRQHRKLVDLLNELHAAMMEKRGSAALAQILGQLIQYTRQHFTAEEAYLQKYGYPDLAAHKAAHEALTKKVIEYQNKFASGTTAMSVEVLTFLKDWLQKHIVGTDKKYSAFLNKAGLQ